MKKLGLLTFVFGSLMLLGACSSDSDNSGTGGTQQGGSGGGGQQGGSGGGGQKPTCDPYGKLTNVKFKTDFVLDGSKTKDDAYLQAHLNAIQKSAAYTGKYTCENSPIPPSGAALTMVVPIGIKEGSTTTVLLQQVSIKNNQQTLPPFVNLILSPPPAQGSDVKIGISDSDKGVLFVMEPSANDSSCLAAIGIGTVKVTKAEGLEQADGGKLELEGSDLKLYHPTKTPMGNVAADLETALKMQICPVK